jgi:hypothetical protein
MFEWDSLRVLIPWYFQPRIARTTIEEVDDDSELNAPVVASEPIVETPDDQGALATTLFCRLMLVLDSSTNFATHAHPIRPAAPRSRPSGTEFTLICPSYLSDVCTLGGLFDGLSSFGLDIEDFIGALDGNGRSFSSSTFSSTTVSSSAPGGFTVTHSTTSRSAPGVHLVQFQLFTLFLPTKYEQ